jgi:hypothetical protein
LVVLAQPVGQTVRPVPHEAAHTPAEQSGAAAGQALLQVPQFALLLIVLTQPPPQSDSGGVQLVTEPALPPVPVPPLPPAALAPP